MIQKYLRVISSVGGSGPCYASGTHVASAEGSVCVDDLTVGSLVLTVSDELRPVRWIGRRRYSPQFAAGNRAVLPVRIHAGALGDGIPQRDLRVSPEHALWIDGLLIPARALINGLSIVQEDTADAVTYLHLELDAHDLIYAEGAPSETYVDDDSRELFDNADEFHQLYPDAPRGEARFYGPRVEDGQALEDIRRRLRERARAAVPGVAALPTCSAVAGGSGEAAALPPTASAVTDARVLSTQD